MVVLQRSLPPLDAPSVTEGSISEGRGAAGRTENGRARARAVGARTKSPARPLGFLKWPPLQKTRQGFRGLQLFKVGIPFIFLRGIPCFPSTHFPSNASRLLSLSLPLHLLRTFLLSSSVVWHFKGGRMADSKTQRLHRSIACCCCSGIGRGPRAKCSTPSSQGMPGTC